MPTRNKLPDSPLRVGVTGGIGSGKTYVCALFHELGRAVLSADVIARDLMEHDPAARKAVARLLGPEAYPAKGPLDRVYVAARVFADKPLRTRLNAIVHPLVFAALEKSIRALPPAQLLPYLLVEAALVYESGLDKHLDRVIVVEASLKTRIRRIMQRDGLSSEEVEQRVAAQLPPEALATRADYVIRNDENATPLREKILFLDRLLSKSTHVRT